MENTLVACPVMALTSDDIAAAAARIAPLTRVTPTIEVDGGDLDCRARVTLKLEYLQQSGTFKARGASNFLLATDIGPDGVVAASGGNHGAAVAWAAQRLGHPANIFVPTISAPAKVERLRSYGAIVHQVGAVYAEALDASIDFLEHGNAVAVHAYEAELVVAGAGTTGREFDLQAPDLDVVLVACGGGGLVGGTATWFGSRTRVVACETEGTDAFTQALAADKPVDIEVSGIAADALGASRIGDLAWAQLRASGATSVTVTDDAVVEAVATLWDRFRIVAEPSAAVPVAAVLSGAFTPEPNEHVGIIICGANTSIR